MRVVLLGPAYPLRGGIAHHVFWLWKNLTDRGHAVQVLSYRKLYPKLFFPGKTTLDTSKVKLDPGALPIMDPLDPRSWLAAFRSAREFTPDLAVIQWWNPFFAGAIGTIARLFNRAAVKFVIECHNVFPHERSPVDLLLCDFGLSPAERFITHSKNDREELLRLLPGRDVAVAPLPPMDEFTTDPTRVRNGRTILFFGIVRRYKGLDVLLRAMPKVLSSVDCKLIVAGEFYQPFDSFAQLIGNLGIEDAVTIDNRYILNEELPALFQRADVLVLPYLNATQSAVAKTALASGLPVIASDVGGLAEVVTHDVTGLLVPPGNPDALSNALQSYFARDLGPRFATNIRNSMQQRQADRLLDVMERFTHERG